jgi:hypothetical protein
MKLCWPFRLRGSEVLGKPKPLGLPDKPFTTPLDPNTVTVDPHRRVSCLTCNPSAESGYESCEVCRPTGRKMETNTQGLLFPEVYRLMKLRHELQQARDRVAIRGAGVTRVHLNRWIEELDAIEDELLKSHAEPKSNPKDDFGH